MMPSRAELETALFEPARAPFGRAGRALQRVVRYLYAIGRDLLTGDLNLRAVGLVFTSLLSTVPLIAFSFSVLKGLGFQHELAPLLAEFFRPLGDRGDELTHRVMLFVDHMKGGVIGSLGLALLLWTVISVVQKVEDACNHIWHVAQARSFGRRFGEYIGVLVIGPIVVAATLSVAASVGSSPLLQWLTGLPLLAPLGSLTAHAAPVLAGTLGFGFLYAFLPNTRVSARAALVAAFASSIVWVAASSGFALVLAYSTQMVAVYAGFSIVLVAILWIWLNWLILLTGVLFAFYLQHPEYLRTGQRDVVATARLADELALSLMVLVARAFAAGNHVTVRRLAQVMDVPSIALQPIADALESAGLLETTSRGRLVPGRDPASLPLDEILLSLRDCPSGRAIALREARTQAGVRQVVRDLDDAIRQSVGAQTLAQLAATPDHDR